MQGRGGGGGGEERLGLLHEGRGGVQLLRTWSREDARASRSEAAFFDGALDAEERGHCAGLVALGEEERG